jgi:hypothetical protein
MSKPARREDPTLPETVRVRVFRTTWTTPAGEKLSGWFVTSLQDAKRFKRWTLAKLYHERWQIEISYLEFKQTFHADVLRSKTVATVEKELAAHVLAYQLVRGLIVAAAAQQDEKPTEVSLLGAARLVVRFTSPTGTYAAIVGDTVDLAAAASTPLVGASIGGVEFFDGATDLGPGVYDAESDTWILAWDTTGAAAGDHLITAVAFDSVGLMGTSTPATVITLSDE